MSIPSFHDPSSTRNDIRMICGGWAQKLLAYNSEEKHEEQEVGQRIPMSK